MIRLPTGVLVAVLMEGWAALVHGRAWHGTFWPVHRSHHDRRRGRRFEANDLLSLSHAPPAAGLVVLGCLGTGVAADVAFGVGIGMTAFGLAYLVVHDGYVHGRLPVAFLRRVPYFERVRRAHLAHHATGGPPYGFFRVRPPRASGARGGRGSRGAGLRG